MSDVDANPIIADPIYTPGTRFLDFAGDRIRIIDDCIVERAPKTILDIGFFPGLIGRRIKERHPEIRLDGVGKLNGGGTFAGYDTIFDAEFDPFYGEVVIPQLPGKYDLILATEIIEHLITPLPFLAFIAAHLAPDGVALITTPNVSSFGAIGRLLKGRSNYESLDRSVILLNNDWRAHVRLYDRHELRELGRMSGLKTARQGYYFNRSIMRERRKGLTWLLRVLCSAIPHWREDQYIRYVKA